MAKCVLCDEDFPRVEGAGDSIKVECASCGTYAISRTAMRSLATERELAFRVAFWVNHQNQANIKPFVTSTEIESIKSSQPPTVERRAEYYLEAAIAMAKGRLALRFAAGDRKLRVASGSMEVEDARALAGYLASQGALASEPQNTVMFRINPQSYLYYQKISSQRASTSQAFVAMSFSDEMREAFDKGIEPAVRNAGYEPLRIDRKETDARIDDEIVAEIRRSAFVVADFTGHRAGVYYEAGFAHGLNKRTIFTCQNSELTDLHFDVRQYNTIDWTDAKNLQFRLQNRILALLGAGPQRPDAKPLSE
jgi:nucleoside 2-deoxyribosyltransferase